MDVIRIIPDCYRKLISIKHSQRWNQANHTAHEWKVNLQIVVRMMITDWTGKPDKQMMSWPL